MVRQACMNVQILRIFYVHNPLSGTCYAYLYPAFKKAYWLRTNAQILFINPKVHSTSITMKWISLQQLLAQCVDKEMYIYEWGLRILWNYSQLSLPVQKNESAEHVYKTIILYPLSKLGNALRLFKIFNLHSSYASTLVHTLSTCRRRMYILSGSQGIYISS